MTKNKKVYFIGIGGIWVSALARYYLSEWWEVFWSDKNNSELIQALENEWCDIIIWEDSDRLEDISLVIHTEAIPDTQSELLETVKKWIKVLKYNQALAEVVNSYKLVAVAGTHGKSTTTSMISQILKNSHEDFAAIVWTLLKEFDGKNFYTRWEKNIFTIEACEYKNHFLEYKPSLAIITNIEYDHADFFKTPKEYVTSFANFISNIIPGGFCIINAQDNNCKTLIWKRKDINYILVSSDNFSILSAWDDSICETIDFPEIILHIPGEHVLFDAKLAYIVGHMIWIDDVSILNSLEDYSWVWRRMEKVWETENKNILISDYAHHPTEIQVTLKALKQGYPNKKIITIFQPHQYSRTLELLDWFKESFSNTHALIIPNIYESRDTQEDKEKINTPSLLEAINHPDSQDGKWLENTSNIIKKYDINNPDSSIFLLLWAGDVDTLRNKIMPS